MKILATLILSSGLYIMGLQAQDLFEARRLTDSPAREGFPSWSPGGDFIVYQYTMKSDTIGNNGLWIIAQDGSGNHQIFKGVAEHPVWSPDNSHIIYDADTGNNIKMIPPQGGDPIGFLPDTIHIEKGGLPCWSPDASQIAYIEGSTRTLYVHSFLTGKSTSVFKQEGIVPLPGCWSVNGKYLYTAQMEMPSRRSTIWKISSDGKEKIQIKDHHENFYRHLALSPDGSLLVYAALEGSYLGLFIMPAEGGQSIPLAVSSTGHNEGPEWSPDGKKIAFSSSRSGNGDIWIMELDIKKINELLQKNNR